MTDLKGKIILVTRVAHFVGRGTVAALAGAGATVIAQDESYAEALPTGLDAEAVATADPDELIAHVLDVHGRIDGVVSNDYHPALRAPIAEAQDQALRLALEDLLVRPFALARAVAPQFRRQQGGRLVFVTSAAPLQGLPNYSIYCTARGAANMLAVTLARELARDGVCVNAVAPNFIESESYFPRALLDDAEARAKIIRNIPLGRLGQPAEVGGLIGFLMSDAAGFVTGHVWPVAGGWA